MSGIHEDLDKFEQRIQYPDFRKNKGLSNEIGNYVFHYDPKDELIVRERVTSICTKIDKLALGFKIALFDLYDVMIELLKQDDILENCFKQESEEGFPLLKENIINYLTIEDPSTSPLIAYIKNNTPPNSIIFLTGVGKVYDFIRSHSILDSLDAVIGNTQVVLFFPGAYDGKQFTLFAPGAPIESKNYYRAFPLNETSRSRRNT
ncbi:DUF1788 domain-containing protein [Treponema primitia]|uniref:DUF1788 domain-containing protein n=1 Tax=Treponema primitia TaxID=88058 RepID=UPI00397EB870